MPPPAQSAQLVLLSPHKVDHAAVQRILRPPLWHFAGFFAGREGLDFLRNHHDVAVVICDKKLPDGDWSHLMRQLELAPHTPSFIVSARLADERLWAKALNLGAFDVLLSAPFDAEEVVRVTEGAWLAWNRTCGRSVVPRTSASVEWRPKTAELKSCAAGCA